MKPSEKPIHRVDQFFKNRLDDHTIAPSDHAWAKVEAGLSKKNSVVLWRWAAAVFLMGALISIVYWSQKEFEKPQPILAEKKVETNKSIPVQEKSSEPSVSKNTTSNRVTDKKSNVQRKVSPTTITPVEIQTIGIIAVVEKEKRPIENKPQEIVEEKIKVEATSNTKVASTQQKPIKLEFTLEDLPSVETVATTNEVKNTGFKKVLELAREIKQGEGPLSNLKEKKNELFAHNFITGKERTQ